MDPMFVVHATADFQGEEHREEAYRRLLPELIALSGNDVVQVNLDIPSLVAAVLGTLPRILALREAAGRLGGFDASVLDRIEDSALALSYAHSEYVTMAEAADDLADLNREAAQTRDRLHSDVSGLSARNIVDSSCLSEYSRKTGYKNVAADLLLLVSVLKTNWARIQGRCACEWDEIARAEKLATRMLRLVGQREKAPVLIAQVADIRARAFTVLLQNYDAARRAVVFLRWRKGDADVVAPSLYAGRKPRRGKKSKAEATSPAPLAPSPVTRPPSEPIVGNAAAEEPKRLNPALPGGSPFMQ